MRYLTLMFDQKAHFLRHFGILSNGEFDSAQGQPKIAKLKLHILQLQADNFHSRHQAILLNFDE